MAFYKHLTPEEAAGAAVGFLTRSLPIPGELHAYLKELEIDHIFEEDDNLTPAERELAAFGDIQ